MTMVYPTFEAQVTNWRLCDFLQNPKPGELYKVVPFELHGHESYEFSLGFQLNIYDCGGFAIGLCSSHKLADGLSYAHVHQNLGCHLPGRKRWSQNRQPGFCFRHSSHSPTMSLALIRAVFSQQSQKSLLHIICTFELLSNFCLFTLYFGWKF